jgi:hypothetical protein
VRISSQTFGLLAICLFAGASVGTTRGSATEDTREPSAGCLCVVARDSATGSAINFASVQVLGRKQGSVTDSLGRCVICDVPAGRVLIRTARGDGAARLDTIWVVRDQTDTLKVTLGTRPPGYWDPRGKIRFGPTHRIDTPRKP